MNRMFLIGIVTRPPTDSGGAVSFEIGVHQARGGREWLERIRVDARGQPADIARALRPTQEIYADGHLIYREGRPVLDARSMFALAEAPAPPAPAVDAQGTHASPRPHDRAGHPRRLHAGTAAERVIWVRPARVGTPGDDGDTGAPPYASRQR